MTDKFIKLFHKQTNYSFPVPKKRKDRDIISPKEKSVEGKSYPRLEKIKLPKIDFSNCDWDTCLASQDSFIKFNQGKFLTLQEISFLLSSWSQQETSPIFKSLFSNGAFPLEVYLVAQRVEGLGEGIYHFNPKESELELLGRGAKYVQKFKDSLPYAWALNGAVGIIITAVWDKSSEKYADLNYRSAFFAAGKLSGGLDLAAAALKVDFADVDAFSNERMDKLLDIENANENSLCVKILGKK